MSASTSGTSASARDPEADVTSGIEFRPYRDADKASVISLLASGRHASYSAEKLAVFDWQYVKNPATEEGPPFLVGTVDGSIVAVAGLMPVKINLHGKPAAGCWLVDLYVSAEHRGHGFGKALVERASVHAPVMLVFGISNMSNAIFETFGWRMDWSMATMFYHARESGLKGQVKNALTRCTRWIGTRRYRVSARIRTEPVVSAAEIDRLWRRVENHFVNAVRRDSLYLSWRYGDSPKLRYSWFTARNGEDLRGLLIARHHPAESVIVDFLGPLDDLDLVGALCAAAIAHIESLGTKRVRCETNHPTFKAALAREGFLSHPTAGRFRVRSNLPSSSEEVQGWFIMTGDSDNDLLAF